MSKKEAKVFAISSELYDRILQYSGIHDCPLVLLDGEDDYVIFQDEKTKAIGVLFTNQEIAESHPVAIVFKLARVIAEQPSDGLRSLAFTECLQDEWKLQRRDNKTISNVFLAACLKVDINIIKDEGRRLHRAIVELLELKGYQHRALWDLVQLAFPHIKKASKDLPKHLRFATAEELFIDIVTAHGNSNYERFLQEDYLEFLASDIVDKPNFFNCELLQGVLAVANSDKSEKAKLLCRTYEDTCETVIRAAKKIPSIRTKHGTLAKSQVWKYSQCFLLGKYNKPSVCRSELKMLNKT